MKTASPPQLKSAVKNPMLATGKAGNSKVTAAQHSNSPHKPGTSVRGFACNIKPGKV